MFPGGLATNPRRWRYVGTGGPRRSAFRKLGLLSAVSMKKRPEWLVTTMKRLHGTSLPETATSRLPNFASVTSLTAPSFGRYVTIGSLCDGIFLPLNRAAAK